MPYRPVTLLSFIRALLGAPLAALLPAREAVTEALQCMGDNTSAARQLTAELRRLGDSLPPHDV